MASTHPLLDITKDIMQVGSDIERYDWHQIQNNQSDGSLATASRYSLATTDRQAIYDLSNLCLEVQFRCLDSSGNYLEASDLQACPSSIYQAFESARLLFDDVQIAQLPIGVGKADVMKAAFEYSLIHGQSIGYNEGLWFDTASDGHNPALIDAVSTTAGTGIHTSILQPYNYRSVDGVITGTGNTFAIYPNTNYNEGFVERYKRCLGDAVAGVAPSVNVMLPLKRIFPVLESMRSIRGVKIEIQLVRKTVMEEVMYGSVAGAKLEFQKLDMWIPRIQPSLSALKKYEEALVSDQVVKLHYHHMDFHQKTNIEKSGTSESYVVSTELQRPVFALVAYGYFDRDSDQNLNSLQFDLGNLSTIRMMVNNTQAPEVEYSLGAQSAHKLRLARVIQDCQQLAGKKASFERDSSAVLNYQRWKDVYPIFPFDLSKIPMSSLSGKSPAEVKVMWTNSAAWSHNYNCYVLLFSERALDLHLKSGKMLLRQA